jgi:cell division septation protein DedD
MNPSRLAYGESRRNTDIGIQRTGQIELPSTKMSATPDSSQEKPPGNDNRIDGSWDAAVIEPATRVPTPEIIPNAPVRVVERPPVYVTKSPVQVSGSTQDGPEINVLEADRDNLTMVAPNRVLPDIDSMDAPAAGVVTSKTVSADDPPVASPVSREDKIATLHTPSGDVARAEVHGNEIQTDIVSRHETLQSPDAGMFKTNTLSGAYTNNSDTTVGSDTKAKSTRPTVNAKLQRQESSRASGGWAINLVTLQQKVNAEHFVIKASTKGVEAEINQVTVKGKKYWRVQVPGFSSPEEARRMANKVRNMLGLKNVWIVQS